MCDYKFPKSDKFCSRASAFWIQSLLSTHNVHSCPQHLSRMVREIDKCAEEFDICKPGIRKPDMRYAKSDGRDSRLTSQNSNYARVTVKPYIRKGN